MRVFVCAAVATIMAACSGPAQVVEVDGYEMLVRKHPSRNVWTSSPALGSGQILSPTGNDIYSREVRAIEAASGCRVMTETIFNAHGALDAAVDCSTPGDVTP